jgi:cobyrinic acid a,c-diamide synthase
MTARGLIVAAPRSGAGKTTVTIALLAALKRRGIAVQAAKVGPDYIDPAFHGGDRAAERRPGRAMKPALLDALMGEAASDAGDVVPERLGLFDGSRPALPKRIDRGPAARFGLPVLLIVDVWPIQSAAALGLRRAVRRSGSQVVPNWRAASGIFGSVGCRRRQDSGPRRDAARRRYRGPGAIWAGAGSRA